MQYSKLYLNGPTIGYQFDQWQEALRRSGSHYFDASTNRYFNSRIGRTILSPNGRMYFVESTKRYNGKREYAVKYFDYYSNTPKPYASPESVLTIETLYDELTSSQARRWIEDAAKLDLVRTYDWWTADQFITLTKVGN